MSSQVLLVEDEPGLLLTLTDLLTDAGYEVQTACDGQSGFERASAGDFDLLILDLMLPLLSGFEVYRRLREEGADLGILMLTARGSLDDRVEGLQLGADDYIIKPFEPEELLARAQSTLRRVGKQSRLSVTRFRFSDVVVDFERAQCEKAGLAVNLARKELQLLRYLIVNRHRVASREELLQKVWDYSGEVNSRTLDVHIAWLRQKLEDQPQSPRYIQTIRGSGYRFVA